MSGMTVLRDIAYAPEHGFRGQADLFLPATKEGSLIPLAVVIHGGGWTDMDKSALHPVARVLSEEGFASFCPNYRLLGDAPWPACGEDCLKAASFIIENARAFSPSIIPSPLVVIGASAGGHLAMMTGLRLPRGVVSHIVSMAGPSDIYDLLENGILGLKSSSFIGRDDASKADCDDASPLAFFKPGCPPLTCVHSSLDTLVPPSHSDKAIAKCGEAGSQADLFTFEGNDSYHGFWLPGPAGQAASERTLLPIVECFLRKLVRDLRTRIEQSV